MDITGLIKKSYRSYGTLLSDDFIAFLKETTENNVSRKILIFKLHIAIIYIKMLDLDNNHNYYCHNSRLDINLFMEKESNNSK